MPAMATPVHEYSVYHPTIPKASCSAIHINPSPTMKPPFFHLSNYIQMIIPPLSSFSMLGSPGNSVPGRHWRGVLWHLGLPRRQGLRTPRRSGTGLPAASGGALRAGGPTAVAAAPGAELPGPQRWLVGALELFFKNFPFHIWDVILPIDFHSIIFQDG